MRRILGLIAQVGPFGPTCPRNVALAVRPAGGWLVAVESGEGLEVHTLDPSGNDVATLPVSTAGQSPIFAERPNGGPLLAWLAPTGMRAAIVAADGASATPPVALPFDGNVVEDFMGAVYTGTGFLVAVRTTPGVQVVRVDLSGCAVGPATTPVGGDTEYPQLAAEGGDVRLTYGSFAQQGEMLFVKLDASGAPVGAPVMIGGIPDDYNPAPIAALGPQTALLLPGYSGLTGHGQSIRFARLDASGSPIGPPTDVATDPLLIHHQAMALRGPDAVLAWIQGTPALEYVGSYPEGIGLARVSP